MPVYAYQCKNCGHAFDVRQSFSDDALVRCPVCHQDTLRKKFNTVGVVFKGSGFYSTDSHASGTGSGGASGSSSTDSSAGSSGSSSSSGDAS